MPNDTHDTPTICYFNWLWHTHSNLLSLRHRIITTNNIYAHCVLQALVVQIQIRRDINRLSINYSSLRSFNWWKVHLEPYFSWQWKKMVLQKSLIVAEEWAQRTAHHTEEGAERWNLAVVLRLSVQARCCRGAEPQCGRRQTALHPFFSFPFLLLFSVHRWECLHSTRITNAASAFKVQCGSVVKLAWAHADAALLRRKATANARGAQAAALRQRRIKLRQSEMKAELKSFRLLPRNYFPRSYFSDRLVEVFITWHVK